MSDSTLADDVHAATFATKFLGHTINAAGRTQLSRYRSQLRQAERFVVNNDLVRLCCHLSHEEDRFPSWSFLARLPYPVMWLEIDLHEKVMEFGRMGSLQHPFEPNNVSPKIGYLLYHDGNSPTRWIAQTFQMLDLARQRRFGMKEKVTSGLLSYVFDPEGNGDVLGSITYGSKTLSRCGMPPVKIPFMLSDKTTIMGKVPPEGVSCGIFDTVLDKVVVPEWFSKRAAVIIDPVWEAILDRKLLFKAVEDQLQEERAAFRYLIALLAAINSIPRDVRPMNVRAGTRTVGMRTLPFLRHSNLTLTVPRDDQVIWVRNHMDRAAAGRRRAWHTVMGHWRVIERGKARGLCRHEPTMVESGVGICQKCELMVRWITLPNGRGDPSIGMVDHAYRLAARKRGKALSGKVSAL